MSFYDHVALLDFLVIVLVLWSLCHALAGTFLGIQTFEDTARVILAYIASAWVYFYVVFHSSERDHQDILIATALSALVLGLHWCIETVSKFVLRQTSMHQVLTADYIMLRNQINREQLNVSVLDPHYRAYGLNDRHTTTGAMISLGGFATIGLFSRFSLDWRILVGCVFFTMLTVGMATLAWLSFVLLVPFAILFSERLVAPGKVVLHGALYCLGLGVLFYLLGVGCELVEDLLNKIFWLFGVQLSSILNFDTSSAQTSWLQIYLEATVAYGQYLYHYPLLALLGEGYSGYGHVHFPRGGDVAIFEFLAIYGLPLSLFLLIGIVSAIGYSVRALKLQSVSTKVRGLLAFSCVGLTFLLFSLAHYNTFFNKSIFVYLFLFLGLIRCYACNMPKRRCSEGRQTVVVDT